VRNDSGKRCTFCEWCRTRQAAYWLAGIAAVLICLRLALPWILKSYVNHALNKNQAYSGQIGDVTVHLWRGAYRVHDIHISKRTGEVPVPFYSTSVLDLSLDWGALIHGAIVSKIVMQDASLNFVQGPTEQQSQSGKETDWGSLLESLVPFDINRLDITNGQIHFQNLYANPPVDIYITSLFADATNFSNSSHLATNLAAGVSAHGKTLGGGELDLHVLVNPMEKIPAFQLTASLTNVDLPALNDFLRAYGKFDVADGKLAIFASFATTDSNYDGYCKIFFQNLNVFRWEKEKKKDLLQIFWEAIVGTLGAAFKNQPHDQLATKVPISGSFSKTDVHLWPTIATLLQNAFIKALVPKLDEPVTMPKVERKESQ
jgi:hypothetical protein